jgi:hypothetical protein
MMNKNIMICAIFSLLSGMVNAQASQAKVTQQWPRLLSARSVMIENRILSQLPAACHTLSGAATVSNLNKACPDFKAQLTKSSPSMEFFPEAQVLADESAPSALFCWKPYNEHKENLEMQLARLDAHTLRYNEAQDADTKKEILCQFYHDHRSGAFSMVSLEKRECLLKMAAEAGVNSFHASTIYLAIKKK